MEKTNVVNHPTSATVAAAAGKRGQDKKLLPPRRRDREYLKAAEVANRLRSERVQ